MKKLLFLFIAMIFSSLSWGQSTANYSFSYATNGSLVDISTGATVMMTGNNDDAATSVFNIGFSFYFMGTPYTQFSANSNGQIRLGSSAAASTYSGYTSATAVLCPMSGDNEVNNGITYKVIGSAPNRILVVEWNQFYVYYTNMTGAGNMQALLYEQSGKIDFIYGEIYNSSTSSVTRSTFISASNIANKSASVTIAAVPTYEYVATTPVVNTIAASVLVANLGSTSQGNRVVYTFTPPVASIAPSWAVTPFTAITISTTTLNWNDLSSDEIGFAIFRSTDGINYTYITTTAANATTYAATGLTSGTTYYWQVAAVNEGLASYSIANSQATTAAATYYWVGATGGLWNTAANWNTAADGTGTNRATPLTTDILIVDGDGTTAGVATTINVDLASFSIGQFKVTNNTACTLQSSATTTRTITVTGSVGNDFVIEYGSTLILNHAANAIAFAFSGTGNTGDISGTYNASGSTSNIITTSGGTSTLVTVSSTGVVNNSIIGSSGCLSSTVATLSFLGGSSYTHSAFTTSNGFIPLATWNATSNVTITGGTTSTSITNSAQTFGNFTYNSATSTGTMSVFASGTATIQGNLNIVATNTGKFRALTSGTLTINGNLNVSGGTFELSSSTGTMNVLGNINVTAGTMDMAFTTATPTLNLKGSLTQSAPGIFLSGATTTGNPTLNFNGTLANQAISFATQPTGAITYRVSNFFGITLSAPFANFAIGNGTLGGLRISTAAATPIALAGSLTALQYNAANTTLAFDTAANLTATALLFPATSGPSNLTVNIGSANSLTLALDRTLPGILTMTSGYINIGSNNLTLGTTAAAPGTLNYTAGSIITTTGTFTRWFPITGLPTTVGTGIGYFPMSLSLSGYVMNRQVQLAFSTATALTTGGAISCGVATAPGITTGLSVADTVPNYTINNRTNSSWTLTPDGTLAASGTIIMRVQGSGAIYTTTYANLRLMKATSIVGRNAAGTGSNTDPQVNRTLLSVADITGSFYIGAADTNSSNIIYSAASGDWNLGSSWTGGVVPGATSNAVILNTHAINVSDAESVLNLVVNNGGTLNVNAGANLSVVGASTTGIVNNAGGKINITDGTLTLGPLGGGNRTFTNNGSLTVASGTLNINGNIYTTSSTNNIFTQSGGNINVDGNAGGNALNSVASGSNLVHFSLGTPTTVLLTGGVFTIVDPHASSTSSYALSGGMSTATNCSTSHTFVFGNGVSTDKAANGFYVYLFPGSSYLQLGNVIVNGAPGMDRFVSTTSSYGILGNLTINSGGDWRTNSSSNYFAGNITVNSGGIFSNPNTLGLASYANAVYAASANAQTISGSGIFRDLVPTASVSSGGAGYTVGDILTVVGGTFTSPARFIVSGVTTGAVTSVIALGYANYSVVPIVPAFTTGGTGTGCTLTTFTNMAPAANTYSVAVNNSNVSGVSFSNPTSISGTLTLTAGIVNTSAANLLTVGTATAAGFVGGGSATAYVNGPLARTFAANRSSIVTQSVTTLFPVGKNGSYLPLWIDPATKTTGPVVFTGEAFTTNSGTPAGGDITNLSSKRWEALVASGGTNLTGTYIQMSDAGIVNGKQILHAASAAGNYFSIASATNFSTATLTTAASFPATYYFGYFCYGNVDTCVVPADQPTALVNTFTTTTSFNASFTAAASNPSNYLVVRYSGTPTITIPLNYVTYAVGASALGGTIVSNSSATTFTQSGLTANTAYTYYVYSYNNSYCYGPIYNYTAPLVQIITTCATPAVVVPGTPTSSLINTTGFTASWTASTTVGVSYVLDVATDAAFTTFVPGFNSTDVGVATLSYAVTGLAPSSVYYVRVRANSGGTCYSAFSSSLTVYTLCNPETAPTMVQNFSTYTGAAPQPFCWTEATGALAASSTLTYVSSKWTSESGFANTGSNAAVRTYLNGTSTDWIISQPIDLGGTVGAFNVKYNMAVTSNFGTTVQTTLGTHVVNIVVSTDGGTTWSNANIIKTYTGLGTYSNTGQTEKVNIPYSGVVKIAFVATTSSTSPSVDFHVDDFIVEPISAPTVSTTIASLITGGTAQSGGIVSDAGGLSVTARGVCWSTSPAPIASGLHTTDGTGTGSFISGITGLTASTLYYYRAYATNSFGTAYGTEYNFTTTLTYPPTVTMGAVTGIGAFTATAGGNVTSDGGQPPVTDNGFVFALTTTPLVGGVGVTKASSLTPGLGVYSVNLAGLSQLSLYYINAFATNAVGTAYGTQTTFTTLGQPSLTTTAATIIESTIANSGGNITAENGSPVTDRGVCWATTTAPLATGLHTSDGSGSGIFTSSITGLTATTKYYYRAFATNIFGTSYGNELNFTTTCVNSPLTTPNSRCGTGTTSLSATVAEGTIKWYTAASGGTAIGTGSPFTTPVISATTNYYAAAEKSIIGPSNVTIGTGSSLTSYSGYPTIFGNYWYQDWSQMVYTAAELQAAGLIAGNITALKFNVGALADGTPSGYTIRIGTTSASILTGFTTTGLTTVYGPTTPTMSTGLNTFNIGTPYYWDGTSNIIIDIRGTGGYGSANATTYYTATTENTVVYAYSSSDNSTFFTSSPTASTSKSRLNVIFAGNTQSICSSQRIAVAATVTPPPAFTITDGANICNNSIYTMNVTSPLSNFDAYTWTPSTGLFTDDLATIPYVAGASATTVYVKSTTPSTISYICSASNTISGCANTDTSIVTILPNPVITATPSYLCVSGVSEIVPNPLTGYGLATFQWQDSPDNIVFTDIPGATNLKDTTPTLTTTRYYKLLVKLAGSVCSESNVATVAVSNPLISTTSGATRCGPGSVSLNATAVSGETLRWYSASTGGKYLNTGSSLTQQISGDTNFYVSAGVSNPGNVTVGAGATTSSTYSNPFYSAYSNNRTQHLITANDLVNAGLSAGNINSVALNVTSVGSLPMIGLSVKIGTTSATSMTAFVNNTGLTQVYSKDTLMPVAGLNVLTFNAPYNWDGISNLVLEFCHKNDSSLATMSRTVSTDATSYVSTVKANSTSLGVLLSNICNNDTLNLVSYSVRPKFVFNAQASCQSARTSVHVTVTPSPVLTLTPSQSICNNVPQILSVTSPLVDYDSYIWSPVTNLYTDVLATSPYTGTSATTLYVKSSTTGQLIYTCSASNTSSGCSNNTKDTVTVLAPISVIATATPSVICASNPASLSAVASEAYVTPVVTAYSFSATTAAYTPLAGGTASTASGDDSYQGSIPIGFSFNYDGSNFTTFGVTTNGVIQLGSMAGTLVGNALASTTNIIAPMWDDNRAVAGALTYLTTGSAPNRILTVDWNNVSIGGGGSSSNPTSQYQLQLFEGSNIIHLNYGALTPNELTASIGISGNSGRYISVTPGAPATTSSITENTSVSSVTNITLGTKYIFTPVGIPTFTYSWDDGNVLIGSTNPITVSPAYTTTYNVTATDNHSCSKVGNVTVTISNGITMNTQPSPSIKCAGQTAMFAVNATGAGLTYEWRKNGTEISPLTNPSALTDTLWLTNISATDAASYDVSIHSTCGGAAFISNAVALTVNPLPTAIASSNSAICAGSTLNLYGTTNIGATYSWTGPNGFVSAAKDTSILSAFYTKSGNYTFRATSLEGCVSAISTTNVVINETPTTITINPSSAIVDFGVSQKLFANGGIVTGVPVFSEYFNDATSSFVTGSVSGTSTITATQNETYFTEGISSYLLNTATTSDNSNFSQINPIDMTAYSASVLKFDHICAFEGSSSTYDYGYVEYSTDDGSTWTTFPATSYAGSGTLIGSSGVRFSTRSYADWITQFTSETSTPGAGPATDLWKTETINIPVAALTSQFKIRFRITTDGSVFYHGWLIDNVRISGSRSAPFVWSPVTDLFTNEAATIPYTGSSLDTVYAKSAISTTYTATAAATSGCTNSASVLVTVVCPSPTALHTIDSTTTTAKIGWTSSATDYDIEYGIAPHTFTGIATRPNIGNVNSITINLLSPSTTYQYKVRAICGTPSLWSAVGEFTTKANLVAGLWTGAISTDWNVGGNWSDGLVPTSVVDVVIPSAPVNQPHITLAMTSPAVCNNLTINTGAVVTIDAGKALTISGVTTNNAGPSGLVLKSDATGTASLLHTTAAVNASVERYIPHTLADEFHMLASPVAAQAIAPSFNELDGFYVWDETTGNWVEYDNGAVNFIAANGGTNFVPGIGYAVAYPAVTTKSFAGLLNQGNVTIPLTYSDVTNPNYYGWNYVANPYPSSVNWDAASGWTRNELEDAGGGDNAMWVWNAGLGAYGAYTFTAGGTNGVSNYIPMSQGYWVKAISAGTLAMTNDVREHASQSYLKSTAVSDRLRLKVSGTANTYCDEIIVKFGNASNQLGAEKMFSMYATAPNLYSTKMNKNWTINNLTTIAQNAVVPVSFKVGANGNYSLHASELNSFTTTTYVYLKDLFTNTITDLNQTADYSFTASTTDNANRFQLIFALSPLSISNNEIQHISIYSYDNTIYVNSNETIKQIAIYNTLGQLIKTLENKTGLVTVNMKEYAAAYYVVRVVTTKNVYSEKLMLK